MAAREIQATRTQQVEELVRDYRGLGETALAVARLCGENLLQQPAPNRWSAGQCLVHLALTTDAFVPLWREAFAKARERGLRAGERAFAVDFWGKVLLWTIEPPPKFRFPAPDNFQPANTGPVEQILVAFLTSQGRLIEAARDGSDLPLDELKIVSPFARRMRYSVWSSACIIAAHQRRHLLQAERAAEAVVNLQASAAPPSF